MSRRQPAQVLASQGGQLGSTLEDIIEERAALLALLHFSGVGFLPGELDGFLELFCTAQHLVATLQG
jgi:hypothetical protein